MANTSTMKGQNLRVFVGSEVVAQATTCTINLIGNTEEESTKDDAGMVSKPEVVSKTWTVQVESLDVSNINTLIASMKSGTVFTVGWDRTNFNDNVTQWTSDWGQYGDALLTDATFQFDDRVSSVKNLTFTGTGQLHHYHQSSQQA